MTKKEKIIAVCFSVSFFMLIISSVYTISMNKPVDYIFNYEKIIRHFIN